MPSTLYPLCFYDSLFERDLDKFECSDGIYVSQAKFSSFMEDNDELVVLGLECNGLRSYAHIRGVHGGESDMVFAPNWMCSRLACEGGESIEVERFKPSIGLRIKIQPFTSGYASLPDPVGALRDAFENYTTLISGYEIPLFIDGQRLIVNILDTQIEGPICIRGQEIEVEIERPLDQPEPVVEPVVEPVPVVEDKRFPGRGRRLCD